MWSKSLESRIVKHEKQSDDIIRYAQELFPDDNSLFSGEITVEEISKIIIKATNEYFLRIDNIYKDGDKETQKDAKIRAKEKIVNDYQDLPKMIEKYRKEDIEILELIKKEEEEIIPKFSMLAVNPILEQIADYKIDKPILRRWADGKFLCYDMQNFIKEYSSIARKSAFKISVTPITITLILRYILDHRTEKPYDYKYVSNMLGDYRMDRDLE